MDADGIAKKFGAALDDYLELSDILMADMFALLEQPLKSGTERRNFLRGAWALVEGETKSLRRICAPLAPISGVILTSKQRKLLEDEKGLSACERVKASLKLSHAIFDVPGTPAFAGHEWACVLTSSSRRDKITHPKTAADLNIPELEWSDCFEAIVWLKTTFRNLHRDMQAKYG